MIETCYLCNLVIDGDPSVDHVPPRHFFARPLRQKLNLNKLVTLPAHGACNRAYQADEEYFVWALAPLAAGSRAADALNAYNAETFRSGRSVGLGLKSLQEFEERPGGLYLPRGLIAKRIEGDRIKRVAWKIVRGLYRIEVGESLPEDTEFMLELMEPENPDPPVLGEFWEHVKATPSRGAYPGIFDYKHLDGKTDTYRVHGWGMLLWDKIIMFIAHVHPTASNGTAA